MRQAALLFGLVLLFAIAASAQTNSANPRSDGSNVVAAFAATAGTNGPNASPMFAMLGTPAADAMAVPGGALSPAGFGEPPTRQPDVQSVFPTYNWQADAGYTYLRFHEGHGLAPNLNGLNFALAYYPRGRWFGVDEEFVLGLGSQAHQTAKLLLGFGGPRVRWLGPRGSEVWAHGLVGGSHFLPQTSFGGQAAFAYELGGGLDINVRDSHLAYRVQVDMVGTHYFSASQYSPKVSIGFVYKF